MFILFYFFCLFVFYESGKHNVSSKKQGFVRREFMSRFEIIAPRGIIDGRSIFLLIDGVAKTIRGRRAGCQQRTNQAIGDEVFE